ncbi:MAG: molybdopterin-dependent oxidoreductase [Dehalococcoidia bacterium]|nr:molybdopterin-dependent oxidoreductase [Dehalococcoidia bacterium]
MKLRTLGFGALTGVFLTAPLIAILYLVDKWIDLSFPPFDTFDWVARILPGPMVTFGIDLMVDSLMLVGLSVKDFAKTAEQIMAVMIFLGAGVVATIIIFALVERRIWGARPQLGALVGLIVGIPVALITFSIGQSSLDPTVNFVWVLIASVAWGTASALVAQRLIPERQVFVSEDGERSVEVLGRRQFLVRMGVATATLTVAGAGIGRVMAGNEQRRLEAELVAMKQRVADSAAAGIIELPNEDDPLKPALGTRPEYTQVRDHYKIFIRSQPSIIDGDTYTLPITGSVENPMSLTIDDIRNRYDPKNEFVTLACISNRVGGDLISTTYWTGASLQDILADLKPLPSATHLFIESEDGFFETVALDLIASDPRIMLAYNWDGRPIPFDHGFPLRIWIPDRYGMKQPKWITSIEVIDQYKPGYWVERDWDEVARMHATAVIDTVAIDAIIEDGDQKLIPVGGIAHAGVRGISKVEVRVDEDGPWQEAQLRKPLSDATWVIWRYDWPFEEGRHNFEVRTYEADGTPQTEEVNPPRPSGATGLHSKNATIEA